MRDPIGKGRSWPRYAKALDLRLAGATLNDIARYFNVSPERARQMVTVAKYTLAFRVFYGVRRYPPRRNPKINDLALEDDVIEKELDRLYHQLATAPHVRAG